MRIPNASQCGECGQVFLKRSGVHRFCESCSQKRDLIRKKLWARDHPPSEAVVRAAYLKTKSRIVTAGADRNKAANGDVTIDWEADLPLPPQAWSIRFCIPFTYSASKNHIYSSRRIGHTFLRRESRSVRESIEAATRDGVAQLNVVQAKVYLDILVQKPDHLGDAVNVIDLVCDGVKRGLGVDDRWFCLRRVDWQIAKDDPQLVIGVSQSDREHHQVCSHCGLIQPLTQFRKKRTNKMGVDRICKPCFSAARVGR